MNRKTIASCYYWGGVTIFLMLLSVVAVTQPIRFEALK